MDDHRAAKLATNHLIGLGHRRIALIGRPNEYQLIHWLIAGWHDGMEQAGLDTEGLLAEGDFTFAAGESAVEALLSSSNPPTAIIGGNDQITLASLAVAVRRGMKVPVEYR